MSDEEIMALEGQIMDRFLDRIEENPDVSPEIVEVVNALSDETDFRGRDQLVGKTLEVKDIDAN